jgi:hypothetical protein
MFGRSTSSRYGVARYSAFFATHLYGNRLLLNCAELRSIDSGPPSPFLRALAIHWRIFFAPRLKTIAAAAVLSLLFVARPAYSQSTSPDDDRVQSELAAMGKRGEVIARVREQALVILQSENACSAWFREADPDSAEIFRSLHYEIKEHEPPYAFHKNDGQGGGPFKHPWAARSIQNGGQNSIVGLNSGGAFFSATSPVLELDNRTSLRWPSGVLRLRIASFWGNSVGAQITTLLHELGHIVGRLPQDGDSWDGQSSRNTEQVLRHCKRDIRAAETSYRSSR